MRMMTKWEQRGVTYFCQVCVFKLLQLPQEAQVGPRTRTSRPHRRQSLHPAAARHGHDVGHHQGHAAGHSCHTESAEIQSWRLVFAANIPLCIESLFFSVQRSETPFFLKLWFNAWFCTFDTREDERWWDLPWKHEPNWLFGSMAVMWLKMKTEFMKSVDLRPFVPTNTHHYKPKNRLHLNICASSFQHPHMQMTLVSLSNTLIYDLMPFIFRLNNWKELCRKRIISSSEAEKKKNLKVGFVFTHSPVNEAAFSFQSGLVDKHDTVSEVLSPVCVTHRKLNRLYTLNNGRLHFTVYLVCFNDSSCC